VWCIQARSMSPETLFESPMLLRSKTSFAKKLFKRKKRSFQKVCGARR
jgi:hypothetical protein